MAFEFSIEQKAADDILNFTKEIKNFENHTVSQGDNKNVFTGQNTNGKVSKIPLDNRDCRAKIQDKNSGNIDNHQRKGSDGSDQKIDISKYKNISITKEFREKYETRIDEKNSREIDKPNASEGNKESLKIVDIKRGGVEGGAIIKWKDGKKYMLKGLYKEKGKYLYKPNAKNNIKAFFTRKDIDGINKSVIEEYVALKLANVVHKGISPDVKLGKIEHKDNKGGDCKYQYCLMTEMAVQKKEEGEFSTLEKFFEGNPNTDKTKLKYITENRSIPSKEIWQNAFAVSVCLLNDRDVNKADNIGVVYKNEEATNLSLFDLGHPTPDKYELDPKTLLPKSMNILERVALWVINLFVKTSGWQFKIDKNIGDQFGTVGNRAEAIENLLKKEDDISKRLNEIKNEFQDDDDKKRIEKFKSKIEKRFGHLKKVLDEYNDKYKKANEKQGVEI